MELYEVLYREGEEELKKYILADSEEDLSSYVAEQDLADSAYYLLATDADMDFSLVAGPTQLTKNPETGLWEETA